MGRREHVGQVLRLHKFKTPILHAPLPHIRWRRDLKGLQIGQVGTVRDEPPTSSRARCNTSATRIVIRTLRGLVDLPPACTLSSRYTAQKCIVAGADSSAPTRHPGAESDPGCRVRRARRTPPCSRFFSCTHSTRSFSSLVVSMEVVFAFLMSSLRRRWRVERLNPSSNKPELNALRVLQPCARHHVTASE